MNNSYGIIIPEKLLPGAAEQFPAFVESDSNFVFNDTLRFLLSPRLLLRLLFCFSNWVFSVFYFGYISKLASANSWFPINLNYSSIEMYYRNWKMLSYLNHIDATNIAHLVGVWKGWMTIVTPVSQNIKSKDMKNRKFSTLQRESMRYIRLIK